MAVKVREIDPPEQKPAEQAEQRPAEQRTRRVLPPGTGERVGFVALGLLAIAMGVPGWIVGARYTVDGWIVLIGLLAPWVGVMAPITLAPESAAATVAAVGAAYSVAEVLARPRASWRRLGAAVLALAALVWAAVIVTDVATTIMGVLNPAETAAAIALWIAARPPAASAYALALTFYPEAFIVGGIYMIVRAVR